MFLYSAYIVFVQVFYRFYVGCGILNPHARNPLYDCISESTTIYKPLKPTLYLHFSHILFLKHTLQLHFSHTIPIKPTLYLCFSSCKFSSYIIACLCFYTVPYTMPCLYMYIITTHTRAMHLCKIYFRCPSIHFYF